jgi:hypothetical protein
MKEQMRCDNCKGFLGMIDGPIMMESGRGFCKGCCREAVENGTDKWITEPKPDAVEKALQEIYTALADHLSDEGHECEDCRNDLRKVLETLLTEKLVPVEAKQ